MPLLEICVDSLDSALAADSGGADRLELCSGLPEGGLTPSLALIRAVRSQVKANVHVMIRPRGGDFLYSDGELAIMREDIRMAGEAGADGVVFGALTEAGTVDGERTRELVELARPMRVTFHRAFDLTRNLTEALDVLISLGIEHVLTSGGEPTAVAGKEKIRKLVHLADQRIQVMVGGGVRADNVAELAETGAREFHSAVRRSLASRMQYRAPSMHLGAPAIDEYVRHVVHADDVRLLKRSLDDLDPAATRQELP